MKTAVLILMLIFARTVSAQVFISEIKYTGNEWIEVSNNGTAVNLSSWKFFEGDTNHKLKSIQGGASLASGEYAIIANDSTKFLSEHSGFSGMLFDSSFSLLDAGETISIKSSDVNIVDTVSYAGIKASKNSTQKINGVWSEAIPTPGAENIVLRNTNVAPVANTNNESTAGISKITVKAELQTRVVLAGAGIVFEGKIANLKNNFAEETHMTWSFGDGASATGETVSHTYDYPGEYTAVLDVEFGGLKATDKMLVHVILPNLSLSTGGDAARSFVTIQNLGGEELDISGWQIVSDNKTFTFPKNMILGARKSTTFASEVTGLSTYANITPELRFSNGTRVDIKTETKTGSVVHEASAVNLVKKSILKPEIQKRAVPQAPQHQEASVINTLSNTPVSPSVNKDGNLWQWYIGVAFLGALALLGLRFTLGVKEKAVITADDFEIIEDEEPH